MADWPSVAMWLWIDIELFSSLFFNYDEGGAVAINTRKAGREIWRLNSQWANWCNNWVTKSLSLLSISYILLLSEWLKHICILLIFCLPIVVLSETCFWMGEPTAISSWSVEMEPRNILHVHGVSRSAPDVRTDGFISNQRKTFPRPLHSSSG
jgi:hypothetical protein